MGLNTNMLPYILATLGILILGGVIIYQDLTIRYAWKLISKQIDDYEKLIVSYKDLLNLAESLDRENQKLTEKTKND